MTDYETEMVMTFNDGDENAIVYTCHKRIMTRLEKLGIKPIKVDKNSGRVVSATYHAPKTWIKIAPIKKVSDERREVSRAAMKRLWAEGKL